MANRRRRRFAIFMPEAPMIEVVNKQRRTRIQQERWKEFAQKTLDIIGTRDAAVTIAFVSDRAIQELNRRFREKNSPTDVLSFPSEQTEFELSEGKNLGDIVISVDRAREQAEEHGLDLEHELAQLILHGVLHLHGYDHETDNGEMNALELKLRDELGI
jgi:probable rRNA maturation factor